MKIPIIFCHYGCSEYLQYTLKCAKLNNPDKQIVLLGDGVNKTIAEKCGVRHIFFDDLNCSDEIELFDTVYKLVQGKQHEHMHGARDWVNFVFKRWFFIFNFVVRNNIQGFWHFDSDNMLLNELSAHEGKFSGYLCTEQCNGMCMNGYISGPAVIKSYLDKINDLFQREELICEQQKEFDDFHPEYAFTEMRAYKIFKEEERIRSIRLNTVIGGSTFDDCICQEHDMLMEDSRFGRKIKKVILNKNGRFFCQQQESNALIEMNSLNLSWVPVYLFDIVLNHSRQKTDHRNSLKPMTLASAPIPLKFKIKPRYMGHRAKKFLKTFWHIPILNL
jgi:hypothetical protein